jgi:hypothetical protein
MSDRHPFTPRTARRLQIVSLGILAGVVIAGFFVPTYGPDAVSRSFGFGAWYGFAACVGLVGAARLLGIMLKRPDRYYDR